MPNYIKLIRNTLWKKSIRRILMQQNGHSRCFSKLKKGSIAGIYACNPSLEEQKDIDNFIKSLAEKGISTYLLLYIPKNFPAKNGDGIHTFVVKEEDLNFYYLPKASTLAHIKPFLSHQFDFLFDVSSNFEHFNSYVLASSQTRFKIGGAYTSDFDLYDLKVNVQQGASYKDYLNLLIQYLDIF